MGFKCHKATEPLQGDSLLFTIQFPGVPGTRLIDLRRMKGWVDLTNAIFETHAQPQWYESHALSFSKPTFTLSTFMQPTFFNHLTIWPLKWAPLKKFYLYNHLLYEKQNKRSQRYHFLSCWCLIYNIKYQDSTSGPL